MMLVKNIIKKVLNLTHNYELAEALDGELTTTQENEKKLMVDCVNLTNCNIATNYVKLYAVKKVRNSSGTITYSSVTSKTIFDIVSVKTVTGTSIDFDLNTGGIVTKVGDVVIKYTYFPDDLLYDDAIDNYPTKINERIFVYGVMAEYLYVKGVFDEAQMWEEKFKLELQSCLRPQRNAKIKRRRWY